MAFTGNHICTSFKQELLVGGHNFTNITGDVFKLALYTNAATFDDDTTQYTTDNEISGTGYTAGGGTLTNVTPFISNGAAVVDFNDFTFSAATIAARGALIYNNTTSNNTSVVVLDFGAIRSSTNGDFTIIFPEPNPDNAIIRIR